MQVTIDRPDLAGLMNSVCSLRSTRKSFTAGGQGVFLMPDIILTAWHVVEQSRNLTVIGPDGRTAEIVRSSPYAKKSDRLDLATVELSRPLSHDVAVHTDTEMYAQNMKGYLVSAFTGAAKCHRAGIWRNRTFFNEIMDRSKDVQHFLCEEPVVHGYSGSPVFDARGRLISVACSVMPDVLTHSTQEKPPSGEYPKGLFRFRGPGAGDTASFVRRALDI